LLAQLMTLPNDAWARVTADAARDPSTLTRPETVRDVTKIVRTHARVCGSCGPLYVTQLGGIYMDLLNVYRAYSRSISEAIAAHGDLATRHQDVRSMRAAKREILRLLSTFVEKCGEPEAPPQLVASSFVPPLLEPVLEDYAQAVPAARDSDALLLLATTIDKLRDLVSDQVPRVLEAVFEPTLRMITTNFEDFPEHRLAFFKLLKATNTHCFAALFAIPQAHHKLIVDSVVWAFKHTERTVAETGLEILHELLLNVSQVQDAAKQPFYRAFVLPLIQDVLAVMTDRLHKSGFKMHATLLRHLFHLVEAGHVTVPLFDGGQFPTNQAFIREHVYNLLKTSFPNLSHQQATDFVVGCFDLRMDLPSFKTHLRDFLVSLKEFADDGTNKELYSEEQQAQAAQQAQALASQKMAVPGLLNPNDIMGEDEDL
jgi:exportin-1